MHSYIEGDMFGYTMSGYIYSHACKYGSQNWIPYIVSYHTLPIIYFNVAIHCYRSVEWHGQHSIGSNCSLSVYPSIFYKMCMLYEDVIKW